MINPAIRAFTAAAVLVAFVICAVSNAQAQSRSAFDGNWSVTIQATSGDCGVNSLYGVVISNGSVRYAGGAGVQMSGSVSSSGAVSVSVSNGSQHASGSGRLHTSGTGSGRWSGSGPTGRCAGVWGAQRSG